MIGVEQVDFVSVPTRDLERARRFYAQVLGLSAGRGAGEFEAGNVTLARVSGPPRGGPLELRSVDRG